MRTALLVIVISLTIIALPINDPPPPAHPQSPLPSPPPLTTNLPPLTTTGPITTGGENRPTEMLFSVTSVRSILDG